MNPGSTCLRALALAAITFFLPAHAAEQWQRIRSANFEMLTDAGEKKGREAVLYFEGVRKFFADSKIVRHMPEVNVRIVAFRSEKEYKPYAPNEVAYAWYQPGLEHDYIVMSSIGDEAYPAATHEYTHLLVQHSGLKLPLWLNEGIADLYSSLQPRGNKLTVGAPLPGRLQILREYKMMPLEALTTADERSPLYNEKSRANVFYAESWALAHMLELSNEYRPRVSAFVAAIAANPDAAKAFETVYSKSLADVLKDLGGYVNSPRFNGIVFNLQLDKKSEEPDVEPISPWDARLAIADFLALGHEKEAQGRKMLEDLAAEDPKRWEPEAGLALLDLRHQQMASALQHFARAETLGANDPQVYFRYAMAVRDYDKNKSMATLRKAIELKPDYEEAYFWMGFEYMEAGDYDKALIAFAHVQHLKPGQAFPFFHSVAYASYRLDHKDDARKALARARQYATDDAQRHILNELANAIEGTEPAVQTRANLAARPAQDAQQNAGPPLATAHGLFVELACEGDTARLGVSANGAVMWFLMDDPHAINIEGRNGGSMELTCGKQQPRPVTIRYVPGGSDSKTAGRLRSIRFE